MADKDLTPTPPQNDDISVEELDEEALEEVAGGDNWCPQGPVTINESSCGGAS